MAEPRTLLELAVTRGGIMKGAKAAEVVVSWAVAERQLGHRLGDAEGGNLSAAVREYASYWGLSERTGWNELRRFKAVFEEESPARLAAVLSAAVDVREAKRHQLVAGVRLAL